jgi:hypothetical protein
MSLRPIVHLEAIDALWLEVRNEIGIEIGERLANHLRSAFIHVLARHRHGVLEGVSVPALRTSHHAIRLTVRKRYKIAFAEAAKQLAHVGHDEEFPEIEIVPVTLN